MVIPGLLPRGDIPKTFTCDGAGISLPVQWNGIPHGTAELAVFIVNLLPVHGHLFFDWAVAGLKPASHGISAGSLPAGAVVGRNDFGKVGYSLCPEKGARRPTGYGIKLLALPHRLAKGAGFDASTLYAQAEAVSGRGVGIIAARYKRQ